MVVRPNPYLPSGPSSSLHSSIYLPTYKEYSTPAPLLVMPSLSTGNVSSGNNIHTMRRQGGNALSGGNASSGNVSSQCVVRGQCVVRECVVTMRRQGGRGHRQCVVTMRRQRQREMSYPSCGCPVYIYAYIYIRVYIYMFFHIYFYIHMMLRVKFNYRLHMTSYAYMQPRGRFCSSEFQNLSKSGELF